eukprot:scaffold1572_cov329-Prasinococcus_capsulatus_cf.AAC.3
MEDQPPALELVAAARWPTRLDSSSSASRLLPARRSQWPRLAARRARYGRRRSCRAPCAFPSRVRGGPAQRRARYDKGRRVARPAPLAARGGSGVARAPALRALGPVPRGGADRRSARCTSGGRMN